MTLGPETAELSVGIIYLKKKQERKKEFVLCGTKMFMYTQPDSVDF